MTPYSPLPQPLALTILHSVSVNLTIVGTSCKSGVIHYWPFFGLAYFTQHNVFKVHLCHSISQSASLLRLSHIPLCIHYILFICLSITGYVCCFPLLLNGEQCCCEYKCADICWSSCFQLFGGIYPEVELLGHKVILFLFILNWRIIALQYCVSFCHTAR